jgi:HemY protein
MRALAALVLVAAAVAAGAFLAGHPGHVAIVWQGWQIDTSVGVLIGAVALVVLSVSLLALLGAALHRVPRNFRRRRAARRRRTGEAALTSGLVALAAGQAAQATRHARRAAALLDGAPLALLLAAEAATRQGDPTAARQSYTALLERPETEFLGLRGLIGQALRAGDDGAARPLAERARRLRPDAHWLADSLLVLEARAGDWAAARATLADAARQGALPEARLRHHQGVVLHELSRAAERRGDPRQAAKLAARAQTLAPDLAEPAGHHAQLLVGLGRKRAAAKAIERAWRSAPHPDLARLYLDLRPEAGPLARTAALQRLAARNPEAPESRLALAEAALAAQLWGEARRHLALAIAAAPPPLSSLESSSPESSSLGPSRRLCRLMARLDESEGGNMAAARNWLDRAINAPPDPSYVCTQCGGETPQWQALCRECGGFDTLFWQTPPSGPRPAVVPPASAGVPLMLAAPELPSDRSPASGLAPTAQ